MKLKLTTSLALAFCAGQLAAQEVTPVWLHHINGSVNANHADAIPVIAKNIHAPYAANGVGRSEQFALGKIRPYDSTRLLMMVKENGIDEVRTDLSQAQKDLAAAYPDRSLIWIDAATGKPLGIAIVFGIHPVVVTGQSSNNDFWNNWDIDEAPEGQRAIYFTQKNTILRYAPKVGGGWESTPTYAWIEPTPGATDETGTALDGSSGGDGSASWRWRDFHVSGFGDHTTLVAGGGTWRASMHTQIFKTADGLKFYPIARFNDRDGGKKGSYSQGGLTSSAVQYGLDTEHPNLITAYHGRYPGTGWEARPSRFLGDPDDAGALTYPDTYNPDGKVLVMQVNNDAHGDLPAFQWEAAGINGVPITHSVDGVEYYDGNWGGILDANVGVDYIVNYAFPSWDNQFGNIKKPGWIGVHRLDGSIASNSGYKLPFIEMDVQSDDAGPATGNEFAYDGDVRIYPDTTAPANLHKSLVVWVGSGYGYGLFTIQNTAASITAEPQNVTITENASFLIDPKIGGSPNTYQWYKDGVALDPAATHDDGSLYYTPSVVQGPTRANLWVKKAVLADSGKYKLVVTNPLGGVTTREAIVTVLVDNVAPTITSTSNGRSTDASYVRVVFSEEVTPETAGDAANYKLNGAAVLGAKSVGPTSAIVYIPTIEPGIDAALSVSNVKDIADTANPILANTTVTLTGPALATGGLLWEFYPGISGTAVDLIETDPSYPGEPSRWERTSSLDTDASGLSGVADNFGARLSGWLTPTVSGDYRFFVASDDASRLYLSPSANPADAVQIAQETQCCNGYVEPNLDDPTLTPRTSDIIPLVAGTSYYIALVYKEGGGGDWAKAAWRKEGDTTAAGSLAPIPGSVLKSYRVTGHGPVFATPSLTGRVVTLSWSGTGTLQESTDLTTWAPVAGAVTNPFNVTVGAGTAQKFYRLVK